MALAVFSETFEGDDSHTVQHDLNNTNVVVSVWQNGYLISPPVQTLDENRIQVSGNRIQLTVVVVGDQIPVKTSTRRVRSGNTSGREGNSKGSKN